MKQPPEKVDHIGIAVKSIHEHLPFYENVLGLELLQTETVESQKVKVAFIAVGATKLELLEPLADDSPIAAFIDKRGEGIHHVALGVTNIEKRLEEIKQDGIKTINDKPYKGAGGADVAFLHPSSAGRVLYELCERK
ncbi:methylmalonyl-CoA epimerase [Alteribacillus persepolensis]|uniref:Methylmalonyl-CoA epimerase n=1 Tax=Alteribacillus persepolensis TaxID=568899 RepID=A0A1G8K6G8_9BACI|nr:methylmalonyl-CoA epimerase [Alteribacillus persepolensis]SDI39034.1 methylmalonyl-CoA epimerase [Alteribacillus persepolensis]